jgi:hypothetical protein
MATNNPQPPTPTPAAPGSPEKIAVLEARAAAGLNLWHPADSTEPAALSASDRVGVGPLRRMAKRKPRTQRAAG